MLGQWWQVMPGAEAHTYLGPKSQCHCPEGCWGFLDITSGVSGQGSGTA